jgi:hypothetical protein
MKKVHMAPAAMHTLLLDSEDENDLFGSSHGIPAWTQNILDFSKRACFSKQQELRIWSNQELQIWSIAKLVSQFDNMQCMLLTLILTLHNQLLRFEAFKQAADYVHASENENEISKYRTEYHLELKKLFWTSRMSYLQRMESKLSQITKSRP